MRAHLAVALAILAASGSVLAQGLRGEAANPTKVEADATGPQDSIGSAGESPTKSMIEKSNKKKDKAQGRSERGGAAGTNRPAGREGATPGAPQNAQGAQGGAGK